MASEPQLNERRSWSGICKGNTAPHGGAAGAKARGGRMRGPRSPPGNTGWRVWREVQGELREVSVGGSRS